MVKVAFWYAFPVNYSGALNYFRNLLYAISITSDDEIKPYIYFGHKTDAKVIKQFSQYAIVKQTSLLDEWSVLWFCDKILNKFFNSPLLVNFLLKANEIEVVFSSSLPLCASGRKYKIINWIPDFQYLHLPELFPGIDIPARTEHMRNIIRDSDIVLVSSYAALEDFKSIAPQALVSKGRTLHFVSQPAYSEASAGAIPSLSDLEMKYGFSGKFFFLPNQFWRHKNHRVVFEAVRLLKSRGKEVLVLCSGSLVDARFDKNDYSDSLSAFISQNKLLDNIKIIGHIEYSHVLCLMRNSLAVLNPSLFEGWSSSVEEARSMGKIIILSDIGVHVEQNPARAAYFNPKDPEELSHIIATAWENTETGLDLDMEKKAHADLLSRTREFAKGFLELVNALKSSA